MSSSRKVFNHISKKSNPNENPSSTPVHTSIFSNCQYPSTLSPTNINPKNDNVLDQLLNGHMKSPPKRLFFDHSLRFLIGTPSPNSDETYRRFFMTHIPSKTLEKEDMVTSSKPKEQTMREVLSLYPEKKFFESMVEMIKSRLECKQFVNSDYLEELLALYLMHNEESLHGHIFSAYTRVMVDLNHTFC